MACRLLGSARALAGYRDRGNALSSSGAAAPGGFGLQEALWRQLLRRSLRSAPVRWAGCGIRAGASSYIPYSDQRKGNLDCYAGGRRRSPGESAPVGPAGGPVLACLRQTGTTSFNAAVYLPPPVPTSEDWSGFPLLARVVDRVTLWDVLLILGGWSFSRLRW